MPHRQNDSENWDERDREGRGRYEDWRHEEKWQEGPRRQNEWANRDPSRRWRQEDDTWSYRYGSQGMPRGENFRRSYEDFDRGAAGYEGHFDTPRHSDYAQESWRQTRYEPDYGGYNRQPGMRGQEHHWDRGQGQGQGWNRTENPTPIDRGWDRNQDQNRMGRQWDRGQGLGRYFRESDRGYNPGRGGRYWDRGQGYYEPGANYGQDWDTEYNYEYEDEPTWMYTEMWWIPGPMSGLGPRGYQRSDERICEDVCERLTRHGQVDASDIEVEVEDGEVTLTGTVNSQEEKRVAEDAIASIPGVMDIHNRLHRTRQQAELGENRGHIRKGMEVFGTDNERIGTVKKIRSHDFLVDRPAARDVYIPFDACQEANQQRIKLGVASGEVDNQNWEQPQIIETPHMGGSSQEGAPQGDERDWNR